MKLPDIQTGQVQSLGRMSTAAPIQLSQAQARAAAAKQNMVGAATSLASDVSKMFLAVTEANAEAEANKALLKYHEVAFSSIATEPEVDEEGNKIWTKPERLNEILADSEEAAAAYLSSDRARELFNEHKYKVDFKAESSWTEKLTTAQVENAKVNFIESLESHAKLHNWEEMKSILDSPGAQLALTPAQQYQYKATIQRGQLLDNYEQQRQNALGNPKASLALKEKVANDPNLSEQDKQNFLASVDINNMNLVIKSVSDVAASKARVEGAAGAVAYLDKVIYDTLNTPAEELGGDEQYKASLIDKAQAIRNDYRSFVQKNTNQAAIANKAKLILSGQMRVSPRHNAKEYNDTYLMLMGGQFDDKGHYVKGSVSEDAILNNEDGRLTDTIAYIRQYGFMPEFFEKAMGTYFINGTQDQQMKVLDVLSELSAFDAETLFASPNSSYLKDVFSLIQVSGQTKEGRNSVLQLWHKYQGLGEAERKRYSQMAGTKDFKKQVTKLTKKILKDKFPAIKYFFFHAKPGVRNDLEDRIYTMSSYYLPMAGGDADLAVNMAIENLKHEYGVTYSPKGAELVHFPPGQVMVQETGLTPRENDAWIYDQLESELTELVGPDVDMDYIELNPIPGFDRLDPQYVIIDRSPKWGGMATAVGIYKPVFADTEVGKLQQAMRAVRGERANRNAELAAKAATWKAEHPGAVENADPVIQFFWTPYEGWIPRALQKTQDLYEDAMMKIFGPDIVKPELADDNATNQ